MAVPLEGDAALGARGHDREARTRRNEDIDPAGFPALAGRYEFDVGRKEPSRAELLVQDDTLRVCGVTVTILGDPYRGRRVDAGG